VVPRWNEDIASERRTVLHLLTDAAEFAVGDRLLVVPSAVLRGKSATVVEAHRMRLVECLVDDLPLLGLGPTDAEAYYERWDRANPLHPLSSDPTIWRIVFRYDREDGRNDPPEWSLAA
jgi:hypothetical protein